MLTLVIVTVFVALLFDFLNGMNDAANSIATIVSTSIKPRLVCCGLPSLTSSPLGLDWFLASK